jgi:hypothetical protein
MRKQKGVLLKNDNRIQNDGSKGNVDVKALENKT